MICRFCGVETYTPTGHETQEACINALETEVSSLRRLLTHTDRIAEDGDRRPEASGTESRQKAEQSR